MPDIKKQMPLILNKTDAAGFFIINGPNLFCLPGLSVITAVEFSFALDAAKWIVS